MFTMPCVRRPCMGHFKQILYFITFSMSNLLSILHYKWKGWKVDCYISNEAICSHRKIQIFLTCVFSFDLSFAYMYGFYLLEIWSLKRSLKIVVWKLFHFFANSNRHLLFCHRVTLCIFVFMSPPDTNQVSLNTRYRLLGYYNTFSRFISILLC